MARVPFVQDIDASPDVRAAFEAANSFNGRVANSMRVFAHSPAIVKFLLPLQAVLQKEGLGCKLDALSAGGYLESPLFGEREKAVIRWAELVTWNKARYDDDAYARLAKYFDSTEIVELTMVAAFRGLMNRFMDSLHIELEGPELQARGGRAVANREDLHAYIEKLVNLV